ncbi:MAG TPA: ABC transporter permease [Cyclobacteriaceae bacterium]|nr:ABC transporter permease [Cyclobacteriaceae bacterium]
MKDHVAPPRLAQKLFDWFCADSAVEDLRGDIDELFYINSERMPLRKAKTKYWIHIFSLMTSYAVKKRKRPTHKQPSSFEYSMDMLKSYFVIATRSLAKHKFFTIINVLGLAIGMSISLLLIAMLINVSTYDEFHVNKDRIYRVISKTNIRNNWEFVCSPIPLAEKFKSEYGGTAEIVRIDKSLSAEAEFNGKELPLDGYFVDPNFLKVFTFPMVKGNIATVLSKPHSIIITQEAAERMFSAEDPIGKVIKMGTFGEFEVTGILKNLPKNSHMQFDILAPYALFEAIQRTQPISASVNPWTVLERSYIYLMVPEKNAETEPDHIETFMNQVAKEAYTEDMEVKATFELQALTRIVPGPEYVREIGITWEYTGFVIFGVLTLLILLPACFNYTNISISRALKRSKEIGLRKVVGGQRDQIFFQFIIETIIVTLLALGVSYLIFTVLRDEFTAMMVAAEFLDLNPTAFTLACFLAFAIFVGLVAGAVPALYFSKLNPIQALKSKSSSKVSIGSGFRKALVVGQFALSLGFIMGVGITVKQHIATLNYNFGFAQENILDVKLQGIDHNIFRNEFSKLSAVQNVSMSSNVLGVSGPASVWIQKPGEKDSTEVLQMSVDHNYIANLDLKLLAGKSFTDQQESKHDVIVNEEFLKQFKITSPADALDKTFTLAGSDGGRGEELRIIGVAKNFHYSDLRRPIQSFLFRYDASEFRYANLKITSNEMHSTISNLEAVWKTIGGEKKFEARFFDNEIEDAYSFYFSMIKLCGFLGFLAISISCLGLLGMVVYTSENRTKEIGVRKVMGASSTAIAVLLSKDYLKLMLIAAIIATPVTIFLFDIMLSGTQHYRIPIGALEIILSLLLMLILGVGTILSQTLKAAKANPVDTLRCE